MLELLDVLVLTLALLPLLTARAVTPIFVTALYSTYGAPLPLLEPSRPHLVEQIPAWATHDIALVCLAILSAMEWLSYHQPELRELLEDIDPWAKALVTATLALALIEAHTASANSIPEWIAWARYPWTLGLAGTVWWTCRTRVAVYRTLRNFDQDDDLRLQRLLIWAEQSFGTLGVVFAFVFPIAALIAAVLALVGLWVVRNLIGRWLSATRSPCSGCQHPCLRVAIHCPTCGQARADWQAAGVFARPLSGRPPHDAVAQGHRLLDWGRCPSCAEGLRGHAVRQSCEHCGTTVFSSRAAAEEHARKLHARLPMVLVVALGCSAFPLAGLIPGLIYLRLQLVSPLRWYIPRSGRIWVRLLHRCTTLVLLCLQPVPLVGSLSLPIAALLHAAHYQRLFARSVEQAWPASTA